MSKLCHSMNRRKKTAVAQTGGNCDRGLIARVPHRNNH
jgi:hypothetical protein